MQKKYFRKWILWVCLPLAFLCLIGWMQMRKLDAKAMVLAESGKAAIALLNSIASAIRNKDLSTVMGHYHPDFSATGKAVWIEAPAVEKDGVRIYAWIPGDTDKVDKQDVRACLGPWISEMDRINMGKIKLDSVEHVGGDDHLRVKAYLWFRAYTSKGETLESQARFRIWMQRTGDKWLVMRQELLHGESVMGMRAGFAEVSADLGIDFVARRNPMFATAEWNPERFEIFKYSSAGVSAADYDNDGYEDLFFCDGAAPALYRNTGAGFVDVTEQVGLTGDLSGFNVALFVDLDNDGNRDLFLGGLTVPSRIYRNTGKAFHDVTGETGTIAPLVATAAAADYDNDGDVDIYLGRYLDPRNDLPTTLFYTRNSAGNSLLRNDGNFGFTDVTEDAGVREGGLTLGVAWGDYDKDGDQDLYVANDFGRNALLRNEGNGTFSDVSAESGTLDFGFGMSATFGDVDNDGDLDIYVSNVHSGQRWYGQAATLYNYLINSVRQGTILGDLPIYREIVAYTGASWHDYGDRMVKGNSLLINDGKGKFTDLAETSNANPFGWYWGSAMFDYDNDGYQDIYAANGWITGKEHDDL